MSFPLAECDPGVDVEVWRPSVVAVTGGPRAKALRIIGAGGSQVDGSGAQRGALLVDGQGRSSLPLNTGRIPPAGCIGWDPVGEQIRTKMRISSAGSCQQLVRLWKRVRLGCYSDAIAATLKSGSRQARRTSVPEA